MDTLEKVAILTLLLTGGLLDPDSLKDVRREVVIGLIEALRRVGRLHIGI